MRHSADSADSKTDVVAETDGAAQSSNPTWDFTGWDDAITSELTEGLVELEIPHRWDGQVLSTDPDDEADVDALLDELAGLPPPSQPSTDIHSDNLVAPNAQMASGVLVSIATCPECGHQMRAEEPTHQSRGAMTCSSCGTKNLPYKWTWGRTTLPPPPQPSEVAVPPTQPPAAGSVPPPLQTSPTPPSGKKPLRRRPVFWIALGVFVLVIIAVLVTVSAVSNSGNSGNTVTGTSSNIGNNGNGGNTGLMPEQKFANDAMGIQTVRSAVNNGTLTRAQIGSYGDSICNLMPQRLNQYGDGPEAFNSIANEFYEGLTHFRISGTDDGKWIALAITDICGAYVPDIPAGVTP